MKEMARVQKENLSLEEEFWGQVLRGSGGEFVMREEKLESRQAENEVKMERKEEKEETV